MPGTWADLFKQPGASVDTMLLLTDGSVVAHEFDSPKWHRLTPDIHGSYSKGTWAALAPMPPNPAIPASENGPAYGPRFFGSAVLGDGTLLVAGGEYNVGLSVDMAAATRFDPTTDTWTNLPTPSGWTHVGDVPLCVLADGRVMIGSIDDSRTAFFDPVSATFSAGPNKGDRCAEESFTLLPDGTVLVVDCTAIPKAEKYIPASNSWVPAGSTPSTLPQACPGIVPEIGPTVVLPNGTALVIGASGNTAVYLPPANPTDPGTWQAGPVITDGSGSTLFPIDAPAVLTPHGRVLFAASPAPPCSFPGPTSFFEYEFATNTVSTQPAPSNAGSPCFTGRFLLLPNGEVLFSNQSSKVTVYTPNGAPNPAWRPAITHVQPIMAVGHHYLVEGRQFNGLSQACSYGDDATMATNYPIARLEQGTKVIYCRTAHHSTMGVATGPAVVSTVLSIPASVPPGSYGLVIVANGIPSEPVPVKIAAALPAIAVDLQNGGDFGTVCDAAYLALEIFNVGDLDLIVDQVMALPPGGDFTVAPLPSLPLTIKSGEHVDFTVKYSPATPGVTATAKIRITSNDPVTPTLDVEVHAIAGAGLLRTVIADHGTFGSVCVGRFADQPLTLCNSGHCPLTVTAIASSSADFLAPRVQSYPLTIDAGDSLAVPIRFAPTSFGAKAGTISIQTAHPAGTALVDVSGMAPAGKLAVTGSTHFGEVDCGSAEKTVTLCNVGDCALHVASVAFSRERRHFELVGNPFPATLHPGSCLGVVIRYEASCEPECCELVITSDDPTDPVKTLDVVAFTRCAPVCEPRPACGCGRPHEHRCRAEER